MMKPIRRLGSVLMVLVLMLTAMPMTAYATTIPAAQQPALTYEQRVAALQANYSVTFGKARQPETWTVAERDVSLRVVEEATALLGSRAARTIARHWINAYGQFGIRAGIDMDLQHWNPGAMGHFNPQNGRINFLLPAGDNTNSNINVYSRCEQLTFTSELEHRIWDQRNVVLHEIGHAYDFGLLQYAGGRAMAAINGP